MFSVDKGTGFAFTLRGGDHLQSQRGFTRRLWPVNLNNTAHRQAASAKGDIKRK